MEKEKAEEERVCATPFDASLALTTSVGRRDGVRLMIKILKVLSSFPSHGQVDVGSIYFKTCQVTKPQWDSILSSVKHATYFSDNITQT